MGCCCSKSSNSDSDSDTSQYDSEPTSSLLGRHNVTQQTSNTVNSQYGTQSALKQNRTQYGSTSIANPVNSLYGTQSTLKSVINQYGSQSTSNPANSQYVAQSALKPVSSQYGTQSVSNTVNNQYGTQSTSKQISSQYGTHSTSKHKQSSIPTTTYNGFSNKGNYATKNVSTGLTRNKRFAINSGNNSIRKSGIRKFESACIITWNKGENFYHCITCSKAKKLTICNDCFKYSEHSLHKHKILISEFNGSCDCGDMNAMEQESFCKQHSDCDQNEIKRKSTFNNNQKMKISLLLNASIEEAKRLAELNKLESVCELSFTGKIIKDYFKNSQCHSNMSLNLTNVYAVYRLNHEINFKQNDFLNETRMLLWHGTKRANLTGIFNTGLKLPLTAGMFGNGIYFADRVSKSANYTDCGLYNGSNGKSGVLLLCEVAVGRIWKVNSAQNYLTKPPDNYDSVQGLGKNEPSSSCTYKKTKIIVPLGTTQRTSGTGFSLQFNEYIVYDPRRVLIKFFVEFDRC